MAEPHDDVIVEATGAPARYARVLARAAAPDLVFGLVDTMRTPTGGPEIRP